MQPLAVDDADEVAPALDDPALHEFIGGSPATADELRRRFRFLAVGHSPDGTEGWLNWVVRDRESTAVVGTAQATLRGSDEALSADIAWVVATPWQGRGFAKEAARAVTEWLFAQGVRVVAAYVHPEHAASAGVARSVGMVPTDTVVDGEVRWVVSRQG
jgi:RimJ/RimL family protein N-acetyltransferase